MNKQRIFLVLFAIAGWQGGIAVAHDPTGPRGLVELDWSLDRVSRVLSAGYGDIGLEIIPNKGFPTLVEIDGRQCGNGSLFGFDVDDAFAFDMDEEVELELIFDGTRPNHFIYLYDRNALAEPIQEMELDPSSGERWRRAKIVLERARFANRLMGKTDFIIAAKGAMTPVKLDETHTITLCGVSIERSHQSEEAKETGQLDIRVYDGSSEEQTPVRMGIYDRTGRMPLPSDEAVPIKYYGDEIKQIFLRTSYDTRDPWPVENRYVFYTDGHYRAELPVGVYELVLSKGPEYRMARRKFNVTADDVLQLVIPMERWDDMSAKGWFSGDGHIHVTRQVSDNQAVSAYMQAEDVHVSNVLQMGNPASTYFHQYAFGVPGRYMQEDYALVPGVEDPRTAHRGHTYSLNIKELARDREIYFLYHRVFETYRGQGGISGYAHVGTGWFNENRGLALDVPLGAVDFVEIMQGGSLYLDEWYGFLNLGFQVLPLAGSDFPYMDQPGSVRSYVKVDGDFSTPAWFDALRNGRTFVTNGPMLELNVDDQPLGSTLNIKRGELVKVQASARCNPDIDDLDRLELVVHGDVVKTISARKGAESLDLSYQLNTEHGMWIAVRAYGKKQAISHTAPVYIRVDGSGTWNAQKAPGIVEKMRRELESLRNDPVAVHLELEPWEAGPGLEALWQAQKPEIDRRIDEALLSYEQLLERMGAQ